MDTPSDRVQLRDSGQLRHPGNCALCGNATCLEGYVDLDIYFEWEGNIYLCMNCVKQVIKVVKGLLPDEAAHLHELNTQVAAECYALREQLNDYKHVDELINRIRVGGIANPDDSASSAVTEQSESDEQPDGNDPASGADAGEPEPKEPTPIRRRSNSQRTSASNTTGLNV